MSLRPSSGRSQPWPPRDHKQAIECYHVRSDVNWLHAIASGMLEAMALAVPMVSGSTPTC